MPLTSECIWLATVTNYTPGQPAKILIQDDEQNLWPGKVEEITRDNVRNEIAEIAKLPIDMVKFVDEVNTRYLSMHIFRFLVFN